MGAPELAPSLLFSLPRAVLTQAVTEVWEGWVRAAVTLACPADSLSTLGACGTA